MGRCYPHLSFQERIKIAKWREVKMLVPEIADRLGRALSTIYRELKRNFFNDKEPPELNGYYAMNAQGMYEKRRATHRKLIIYPQLKAAVEDRLKAGWSPDADAPLVFPKDQFAFLPRETWSMIHGSMDPRKAAHALEKRVFLSFGDGRNMMAKAPAGSGMSRGYKVHLGILDWKLSEMSESRKMIAISA